MFTSPSVKEPPIEVGSYLATYTLYFGSIPHHLVCPKQLFRELPYLEFRAIHTGEVRRQGQALPSFFDRPFVNPKVPVCVCGQCPRYGTHLHGKEGFLRPLKRPSSVSPLQGYFSYEKTSSKVRTIRLTSCQTVRDLH